MLHENKSNDNYKQILIIIYLTRNKNINKIFVKII